MNKKKLLIILLIFLFTSGIAIAKEKDNPSLDEGNTHSMTSHSHLDVHQNDNKIADNETVKHPNDMNEIPHGQSNHEHGSKQIDKNFSLLYIFLVLNLVVLVVAASIKHYRKRTAVA